MAQNDIIDLDAIISDPELFQRFRKLPSIYSTQDDKFTRGLEIDKLAQYGFDLDNTARRRSQVLGDDMSFFEKITTPGGVPAVRYDNPALEFDELITADKTKYSEAVERGLKAGDPYFYANPKFIDRLDKKTLGEFYGIDYDNNLPKGLLRDFTHLPNKIISNPESAKPTLERLLRQKFRETGDLPENFDFDIKLDPSGTVGYTFQNPTLDGKRSPLNPPGMQFGDTMPFIEQLSAEVLAGIATFAGTRSPTAGVLAEGLAGYTYRYTTLKNLQDRGIIDPDYDINMDAMKEMGLVMGLGLSANAVINLIQRYGKTVPGMGRTGFLPMGIDEKEFIEGFEAVSKEIGDNNLISMSNLTTPQVMRAYAEIQAEKGGPKLTSPYESAQKELEQLTPGQQGGPLRQKFQQQDEAGETAVEDIFETGADLSKRDALQEGTDIAMSRTGTEVREATEEFVETAPNVIIAKDGVEKFVQRNSDEFTKFLDGGVDVSPADLTRRIQEDFYNLRVAKQTETDEAFDLAFDAIKDKRKKPFDMSEVAEVFEGIIKQSRDQVFPPGELIGIAKRAVSKIKGTDKIKGQKFQSRESFDADLEELRGVLFDAYQNPTRNRKLITELERVVETYDLTRYNTLAKEGGKGSTGLLDNALDKYKELSNEYKSGLIGDITRLSNKVTNTLSTDSLSASNRLLKFINSGSTITDDGVISSPEYLSKIFLDPSNAKLVDDVRLATKNNLFENVFEIKNGRIMPKEDGPELLRQWKNDNASVLDEANGVFTKKELQSFDNVDGLANRYRQELDARELFLQKAKDNVDIKVITEKNLDNPEIWFSQIFEPNNVTKPAKLFETIKAADNFSGGTQLMDKVKLAIYDDFMKNTSSKRLGTDVFDSNKIDQYISQHGSAMGIFLGDQFVANLGKLNRQLKTFLPAEGQVGKDPTTDWYKAGQSVLRAYVGLFTRPGRFLTAANYIARSGADKKSIDLMTNPNKLYEILIDAKKYDSPTYRAVRRLVSYTIGETLVQPEEPKEEDLESIKAELEEQSRRVMDSQIKDLMQLKYDF